MLKISYLILVLFLFINPKVESQDFGAANEILIKILKAEAALNEEKQLDQGDLQEIVCLTNIDTKNGKGDYNGISFLPSESEIQLWKDWFEENKDKISYSKTSDVFNKEVFKGKRKVIQIEFEKDKFRNTVCNEDKEFQSWWPEWNSKKQRSH